MKPRLLDLFAGAQGAGVGYARAGFEVHAVDIEEHARHPEVTSFTTADALDVLADTAYCRTFHVIHASPLCQRFSRLTPASKRHQHPDLITPVLALLRQLNQPWIVENVEGSPLVGELILCGSMFGLAADCLDGRRRQLRRHRPFASSEFLVPPGQCRHQGQAVGVYGHGGSTPDQRGYVATVTEGRQAMGIDWMTQADLSQAIPPAYTQWIGEQMLARLAVSA